MPLTHLAELLQRRWLHAYEEDTPGKMVFRTADQDLPPSRGRFGFELRADHTAVEVSPGRGDAPQQASGHWELLQDPVVILRIELASGEVTRWQVVEVEPRRLVVKSED